MKKTVVVASNNPVKARAVRTGFQRMFPEQRFEIDSVVVPSGVADQPRSSNEALTGARNRADRAAEARPQADYWVGVEGGIEDGAAGMAAFAWIVVRSASAVGQGRTATFFLPERVAELVRRGRELGEADDVVFDRQDSKKKDGAIGLLTAGVVDRSELYEHGVVMALVPFKNPGLFGSETDNAAGG